MTRPSAGICTASRSLRLPSAPTRSVPGPSAVWTWIMPSASPLGWFASIGEMLLSNTSAVSFVPNRYELLPSMRFDISPLGLVLLPLNRHLRVIQCEVVSVRTLLIQRPVGQREILHHCRA